MKKILLSATAIATVISASAFAADLPSRKAAPIAAPAPMWTGFYAGLNAGYGWGTNSNTYASSWAGNNWQTYVENPPAYLAGNSIVSGQVINSPSAIIQSGFIGGGQFGYNYQLQGNLLLGFEADFQGSLIRGGGSSNSALYGAKPGQLAQGGNASYSYYASQNSYSNTAISSGLDYLGTARGRFGYILTPSISVYATGGLAYGGAWANATTTGASNLYSSFQQTLGANIPPVNQIYSGQQNSRSSLLVGYSAGGGIEWMFAPNWSVKTEALYYNLGNMNVSTASFSGSATGGSVINPNGGVDVVDSKSTGGLLVTTARVNYQGIIARAGVNYHFNFVSAPVVAKF